MRLGLMQPYFLPYIGYFQLINAVDKYIIYDDVQFIKGGWINRNYILLNKNKYMFNLVLEGASANKLINEIAVNGNQTKLIKIIDSAYKKAPYYNSLSPVLDRIFNYTDLNLARFVGNGINEICLYLNIATVIVYSSEIDKNNELKGQDKVIEICKLMQADEYYNAIGGQELYDRESFSSQNIELKFIKCKPIFYKQFNGEFIPWLSMLDILMFNPKEEIKNMLDQYDIV